MGDEVFEQARQRTGPLGVILIDEVGVVRSWSDGAEQLFGYAASEAVGREVAELIVPEPLRAQHRAGVRSMADVGPSGQMGGTFTRPACHASGEQFPVQLTLVAVGVGRATWTVGVIRPVSDDDPTVPVPSLDVLAAVFERAPEAITILDDEGRQINVNATGAALFGYGGSGRHVGDGRHLVHPDDLERVLEHGRAVRSGLIPWRTPLRFRALSGTGRWMWLETLMADLRDVRGVDGVVAFSRDVTEDEQRRIELAEARELAEATGEELRQLAESRLTFAASVSHELRTPLTSISSAIEILRSPESPDADDARTYLSIIDRNTRRLTRLVEELLLFSRAEAGLLQLFPEPIDHLSVVEEAVEALRPRATTRSVRIEVDAVPGPTLHHDPDRVMQIVQNLVDNAVKYAEPASVIRVGSTIDDGTWTVTVENVGPIIGPAEVDGIFQPFFRGSERASGADGAGLGLPLSRHIAELAGGTLTCDPTVRDGARFVLVLPVAQPDDEVARGR